MPYKYSKLRRLFFRNNVEKNLKQLTDEDFRRGLKFHAKYVGSLEISRPVSRVEIVAAMRRVRFEFRVRGSKKKKVSINVSVDGVQVNLTNRRRALVSHHPISKIFYVSHDSQDLKIFSYITSNETSKIFRCNVFKSFKMSQAVEIVKTIGQAFDVCHKLSVESNKQNCEPLGNYESPNVEEHLLPLEQPLTPSTSNIFHAPQPTTTTLDSTDKYKIIGSVTLPDSRTYNGFFQAERWDRLRQQVAEQKQQNDLILIQMQVLQNQLEAEHSSRINAEVQMQDLMRENQNLLFRIHSMMRQVLLRSDSVIDASKSNPVKNKEIEFSVQNDVSSSSFDGTFFHQSPDSGHDDTISSTLSRFRNANTWRSSACQFQLGDESGLNDDREKSEVIENSFHQENSAILATSPMPGSSLFADSVGSSRTNFSKHLPVVG